MKTTTPLELKKMFYVHEVGAIFRVKSLYTKTRLSPHAKDASA